MKPQPFVVTPDTYARALNVVGETVTVLASNASTQSYEIFLQQGDEGTGPPPHSHDWDESFYVVKGTVEISHGGETSPPRPAHWSTCPRAQFTAFALAPAAAR